MSSRKKVEVISIDDEEVKTEIIELAVPETTSSKKNSKKRARPATIGSSILKKENNEEALLFFQYQKRNLRISASDVAGMTGYNPWKSIPELAMRLVYQGGQDLLQHDALLLGLEIVTEEEQLLSIANKAGKKTTEALQKALAIREGKVVADTVQDVQQVKNDLIKEAKKASTKLTVAEQAFLQDRGCMAVNTGFGTTHEDAALNLYEKQCGFVVSHRNAERCIWPFVQDNENKSVVRPQTPITYNEETTSSDASLSSSDAYFTIVGSIDGMRDEIATIADDDSLTFRKIIVECKHRVNRIHKVPPLYEHIQTSIYCMMYGTEHADLVQVWRPKMKATTKPTSPTALDKWLSPNKAKSKEDEEKKKEAPKKEDECTPVIHVNRIHLYDPVYQYVTNWNQRVLPRLVSFVDAIYTVRREDDKRYRLLVSSTDPDMKDGWALMKELCPWLNDCEFKKSG